MMPQKILAGTMSSDTKPRSILIIQPGSLADVVHTLPAIALLREAHPQAKITWVINPDLAPLLRGNPDINHVHFTSRGELRGLGGHASFVAWARKTRELRPDLALDFHGTIGSALTAKISCAKNALGIRRAILGPGWLHRRSVRVDRHTHPVESNLKLAECAGATIGEGLRCSVPSGDPLPRFDPHPPFVLLHPFARRQERSLSNAVIEGFCRLLAPTRVVVVGQLHRKISTPENCVDLTRQTSLLQLVWLIRLARFIVSVESGPMHLAAALTGNLLSIHTWTDPHAMGPYNPEAWVWKHGQLSRVGELDALRLPKHGRRFKRKDVESVVELIRPLVPIDPMVA
jgi:ADP-heptose:LPS heptosyltransferase